MNGTVVCSAMLLFLCHITSSAVAQFCLPLAHIRITSPYGLRCHPVSKQIKHHYGTDFRARYEPVFAVMEGRVIASGEHKILGKFIRIKHGILETVYGHLSKLLVGSGSLVESGDQIGVSGNSGRTTAPHLHFAMRLLGKTIDPVAVITKIIHSQFIPIMKEKQVIQEDQLSLPALLMLLTDHNKVLLSPAQAEEYGSGFADELPDLEEEDNGK
ncbi:M23 family metallopeptidase [Pedobacter sp. MC2016-05]|uniref:M23 family metallopeptidase n=1 Tax=Pedobacter sp. MC2016-05 TaxID=2994474 RepID=UPI002245BBAF|nr:M23 family metallopeptidase [Pedobacter sp. MC2016-05]MCX2476329.1 M23 family metallopeptidase [Pedobacter sp. MC2016-05]